MRDLNHIMLVHLCLANTQLLWTTIEARMKEELLKIAPAILWNLSIIKIYRIMVLKVCAGAEIDCITQQNNNRNVLKLIVFL